MAGFGAFGKMPALGDFFRLGVAADFVPPWDAWLQATLLAAEQALGARFDGCYMSAPIWRFAVPPGVVGQQGVVGVMMPSVDRVGRRFPLTLLAQTGQAEQAALRNLIWQAEVLARLEDLALQALDDLPRDALAERLAAMVLRPPAVPARMLSAGTALVLQAEGPDLLCTDLALDLAGGGLQRSCAWSAVIEGAARLILTSGLPGADLAPRFFDIDGVFSSSISAKGLLV